MTRSHRPLVVGAVGAVVLACAGMLSACATEPPGDGRARPPAHPPTVTIASTDVRPVAYEWYSERQDRVERRRPAHEGETADRPHIRGTSGTLRVRVGSSAEPDRLDVAFYPGADATGRPTGTPRTTHCADHPRACHARQHHGAVTVSVDVPPDARFVAVDLAYDEPDFASALPVRSKATYSAYLDPPPRTP